MDNNRMNEFKPVIRKENSMNQSRSMFTYAVVEIMCKKVHTLYAFQIMAASSVMFQQVTIGNIDSAFFYRLREKKKRGKTINQMKNFRISSTSTTSYRPNVAEK